jgi:uncharacterized protein (DUF58 family)
VNDLLDGAFIRELRVLERRLQVVARSGFAGDRLALRRGISPEFAQHRPYVAGDDIRHVDWLATARSGAPVLKQFQSEEDAIVRVLIDRSASLSFGSPSKLTLAKRLAAALGYLALVDGARLELVCGPSSDGASVTFLPQRRGKGALVAHLRQLDEVDASGETHLGAWVRELVTRATRPGLLIVLSDFFDPDPVLRELDLARGLGHQIAIGHVLEPADFEPTLEGDLDLIDVETGARVSTSIDPTTLGAHLELLFELCERLSAWSRQRAQAYARLTQPEDLFEAVRKIVMREQD